MQIFFSVGEPSGDQHAAHLIEELRRRRPEIDVVGYGGPLMERAGCRLHFQLTELAVMGFTRVLPLLWRFYLLVRRAGRYFRQQRPDAVVLVDFPGFNWWIARKAKRAGIPVFYYLPPQLWAWAPWRVKRMQRFVDHVLCALPFEPAWYAERGLEVEYVGHPFFDEVAEYPLDREFIDARSAVTGSAPDTASVRGTESPGTKSRRIGILPGSRNVEVHRNWPLIAEVMRRIFAEHPDARFYVACYRPSHRDFCRDWLRLHQLDLPVEVHVGRTSEIIELAECCLIVSGSVSLELLARQTPAVVTYRVGWMVRLIVGFLIRCKYVSLPNLFADAELMPEFVYAGSPASRIGLVADTLNRWLSDAAALSARRAELSSLCATVVQTGATGRTAEAILRRLPAVKRHRAA